MEIFDSHAHLYFPEFDSDRDAVIARARAAGVQNVVNIGVDLETSRAALALAEKNEGFYATLGWHPHEASRLTEESFQATIALKESPLVKAVGEIGLDYFRDHSPRADQARVFRRFLEFASESSLPVAIHTREAFADTLSLLREFAPSLKGILIHCFTGTAREAAECLALGASLAIPGVITYKKTESLQEAVRSVPLDRILVETDSPYLAPVPFRGKRGEPAYLIHHLQALGALYGLSAEEMGAITARNARAFFGV
ncbi:MAG: TatD family hydrolase [Deltaproteobacteria bacterium]|jgi:TatD DNase family protein|nr:TatD family hydrolase [Deltaproteobacteria bacterium]